MTGAAGAAKGEQRAALERLRAPQRGYCSDELEGSHLFHARLVRVPLPELRSWN